MYNQFAEIENDHWWFLGRRYLIKEMLLKTGKTHFENALDIGCGVGGNVNFLKNYCTEITGLDFSEAAVKLAKEKWPSCNFLIGDANKISSLYEENSFDLVTVLNVLYHQWIINDEDFLEQTYKILNKGGYIVITEPAFMHLWRQHDIQDMGKIRYRLKEMKKMLKQAGFVIVSGSYFNSISYVPVLLSVLLYRLNRNKNINDEKKGVEEIKLPGNVINTIMLNLLKAEARFIKLIGKMPIGVSLICVAKKM